MASPDINIFRTHAADMAVMRALIDGEMTPITITTVRDREHLIALLDGDREFALTVRNTEDDA